MADSYPTIPSVPSQPGGIQDGPLQGAPLPILRRLEGFLRGHPDGRHGLLAQLVLLGVAHHAPQQSGEDPLGGLRRCVECRFFWGDERV